MIQHEYLRRHLRRSLKSFLIVACGIVAIQMTAQPVNAQTTVHSDGKGYTYRSSSGNYTHAYRYDTGATYNRYGSHATYRDNTGTSGSIYYGQYGRYDNFNNSRSGWSGSGYTSYDNPSATTYHRTGSSSWLAGLGLLGLGGGWGVRRWLLCG